MKRYLEYPNDFDNIGPGFPVVHESFGEGTFVRRDMDINGRPVYYFRFAGIDHPLYGNNISKEIYTHESIDDRDFDKRDYDLQDRRDAYDDRDNNRRQVRAETDVYPENRFERNDNDIERRDYNRDEDKKSSSGKIMTFEEMFDSLLESHKKNDDGELTRDVWTKNYDTSQLMIAQLKVIEADLQEYSNDMATGAKMFDKSASLDPERDMADWGGRYYDYRDKLEEIRRKLKEISI